ALGLEAADTELVSVHAAVAFADRDGHAGYAAQRLVERGDVLLAELPLPDHIDGLGRVADRSREAADSRSGVQRVRRTGRRPGYGIGRICEKGRRSWRRLRDDRCRTLR